MTHKSAALPWSYSKLSTYERCPASFKFKYVEKKRAEQSPQASRGTDTHKTIEDYLTGASRKLHEAVKPFEHVFDELKEHRVDVEYKLGITAQWKSATFRECWGRSVLDSAYIENTHVEIQEWKTGKMYDDHSDQRHLYLAFAGANWPQAQTFRIQSYYFDLGKKKPLKLTREELGTVRNDFNARVAIMCNDDILAPRPGFYCGWCPYSKVKGGPCRHG